MSVSEDWMQDFYFFRVPYVMHLVSHILAFAFWLLQAILLCFLKENIYNLINHLSLPRVVSLSIIPFHGLPAYVLQSLG